MKKEGVVYSSLCLSCLYLRTVSTARGSQFILCLLSEERSEYRKYPPQPVLDCEGYKEVYV